MSLVNGFLIDATGRCTFNDADAIVGTYLGIPVTTTGETAASQVGPTVVASNRGAFNSLGRLIYQDVALTPYAGAVFVNGAMSFTQSGALLCDSASPSKYFNGGLPYSAAGYLCIDGDVPLIPFNIVTQDNNQLVTEAGDALIT